MGNLVYLRHRRLIRRCGCRLSRGKFLGIAGPTVELAGEKGDGGHGGSREPLGHVAPHRATGNVARIHYREGLVAHANQRVLDTDASGLHPARCRIHRRCSGVGCRTHLRILNILKGLLVILGPARTDGELRADAASP